MSVGKLLSLNTYNNPSRVIACPEPVKRRSNLSYLFCLLLTAYCLLVFFGCASAPPEPLVQESRMEVVSASIAKDVTKREDLSVPLFETDNFSPEDSQAVAWVKLKDISGKHTLRWEWYDPKGNLYFTTGNYAINTDGRLRRFSTIWHKIAIKGEKAGTLTGKWKVRVLLDNVDLIASKEFEIKGLLLPPPVEVKPPPVVETKLPPYREDAYALIIGIDYKEREKGDIPPLKYAAEDAQKVYNVLTDRRYGRIPPSNVKLLLNKDASRENIMLEFDKIAHMENGYMYVYFSGHGAPKLSQDGKFEDAYLIPYNTNTSSKKMLDLTTVPLRELKEAIGSSKAKGIMVALDACFSGAGERKISVEGTKPLVMTMIPDNVNLFKETTESEKVIITSSSMKEESLEESKALKGGIFSYFLIEGMKGKASKSLQVKVNDLARYIQDNVNSAAKHYKQASQHPQVIGKGSFEVTLNWERENAFKKAALKLSNAFNDNIISSQQYQKAITEMSSENISDILDMFISEVIDETEFAKWYR